MRTPPLEHTEIGLAWFALRLCLVHGRWLLFAAGVLAIVTGLVPAALAVLSRLLVQGLVEHVADTQLMVAGSALVAVLVVAAVAEPLGATVKAQLSRRAEEVIQAELFAAVNAVPGLALLERPSFHDRLELAQQGARVAPQAVVAGGLSAAQGCVALVSLMASLALVAPVVALTVVVGALPMAVAEIRLSREDAELAWSLSPSRRRMFFYASLQTDLRAAKEVRVLGIGDFLRRRMLHVMRTVNSAELHQDIRVLGVQVSFGVLGGMLTGIAAAYVAWGINRGRFEIGDMALVLATLSSLQASIAGLIHGIAGSGKALLLLDHFRFAVEASRAELARQRRAITGAGALPDFGQASLDINNVWFRYGDDQPWILRGVNLSLAPGRALALVGLNGAGKSTLVKLVCGLYEPTSGNISWGGRDLRSIPSPQWTDLLGVVFQDFMTYDLTAAENIGIGDLRSLRNRERITLAAAEVGLNDVLTALPKGYDTVLSREFTDDEGSDGVVLSGGQWQRLALARALIRRDARLLILDEPSSGLDPFAERELHALVGRIGHSRMRLLISHRLNAVRDADVIAVLSGGIVVERGSHDELMDAGGTYAEMFTTQAEGFVLDA